MAMGRLELPEDEPIVEINLTPLVDVSLVLVIIFMIVSPFLSQVIKPLTLPGAATSTISDENSIKVSLFADGTMAVGAAMVDPAALESTVRGQIVSGRKPWVLVRGAAELPHSGVMRIVGILRKAGADRVAFATVPKGGAAR